MQQLEDIKSDYSLFSKLYISCQVRAGGDGGDKDLYDFFCHENHPWPPSLSDHGALRLPSSKSDLLQLLPHDNDIAPAFFDAKVFDGPAIVHSVSNRNSETFSEYSKYIFGVGAFTS